MIRISLYSTPVNGDVFLFMTISMGNIHDFETQRKDIQCFFATEKNRLSIEYNETNMKKIVRLYHNLKTEEWEGNLTIFTDDEKLEIPNTILLGYDICAESMYYSPLGDGFLLI